MYKKSLHRASLFSSEVISKKSVKKQIDQTSKKKKKAAMAAMKMEDAKFNGDFFSVPTTASGSQQLDYTMVNLPHQLDYTLPSSSFLSDENFEYMVNVTRVSEEAINWKEALFRL